MAFGVVGVGRLWNGLVWRWLVGYSTLIMLYLNVTRVEGAFNFQASTTATSAQCPCVVKPGTRDCLKYDSRYQATSVEEAISFFDDLSLQSEYKPPEQEGTAFLEPDCTTRTCKVCKRLLRQKLHAVGLFRGLFQESGFENFIDPSSSETHSSVEQTCHRYRFSRKNSDAVEHHQLKSAHKQKKSVSEKPGKKAKGKQKKKPNQNKNDGRSKRAAAATNSTADPIGIRYNLSCTPKGSTVDSTNNGGATGLINLCSKCWAWRQLPVNYFPNFINELVCHDSDLSCLSGYAKCGAGTHAVEVIRNDSNKLTVMTVTAGSYCECQVYANSALQSLVVGTSPNNWSMNTVTDG